MMGKMDFQLVVGEMAAVEMEGTNFHYYDRAPSDLTVIPSGKRPFQFRSGLLVQNDFDRYSSFPHEFHLIECGIHEFPSCTPRFGFPVARVEPSYLETSQDSSVELHWAEVGGD
jgi:hypothetical protein